jgi:hypothetical protein
MVQDASQQTPAPPPASGGDFSNITNPSPDAVVPPGILVKSTVASATDSSTPLPEGGSIVENIYRNRYFGLTYSLPAGWYEKTSGPPPSDRGYYVLSQLRPTDAIKNNVRGSILVAAQDLFFPLIPAGNTMELIQYTKSHLMSEYQVERPPTEIKIAGRSFVRFDYTAPVAGIHWSVLATQIRCHTVEFIFTSRDDKLIESLVSGMDKMALPAEAGLTTGNGGGDAPVCIKNYATGARITHKVDPVLLDRRYNPIPVRIIISKTGTVKYIHFMSAYPEQSKTITDALLQWTFKPYLQNGQPVEVETGIMFGIATSPGGPARASTGVTN